MLCLCMTYQNPEHTLGTYLLEEEIRREKAKSLIIVEILIERLVVASCEAVPSGHLGTEQNSQTI